MNADVFRRIHPAEFQHRFLKEGVRSDGRALLSFRRTAIFRNCISNTVGSAVVRMGKTRVVCGVSAQIGTPNSANPKDGKLAVSINYPPSCSPKVAFSEHLDEPTFVAETIRSVLIK